MGCDIHGTVERKVGDKWICTNTIHSHESSNHGPSFSCVRDRNYRRFAALAGVRGDGPTPRGLPDDVSETTKLLSDDWDGDGHSHSWLPLGEACKIFLTTEYPQENISNFLRGHPEYSYFRVDDENSDKPHRFVFWFDN